MQNTDQIDYDRLKAFASHFFGKLMRELNLPAGCHPISILESMERKSQSRAASGLKVAINDILEMTWHATAEEVVEIDRECSARNLLTLSQLRVTYSRKFRAMLKRGVIRSEIEYYLVSGIIASQLDQLPPEDASRLDRMLHAYESRTSQRQKGA